MEIKSGKLEISKNSWVYRLLDATSDSHVPSNSCMVAWMVAWRSVIALFGAGVIGYVWVITLTGNLPDSGGTIPLIIITWMASALGTMCLSYYLFTKWIPKWIDNLDCLMIHWKESSDEN